MFLKREHFRVNMGITNGYVRTTAYTGLQWMNWDTWLLINDEGRLTAHPSICVRVTSEQHQESVRNAALLNTHPSESDAMS